MLNFFVRSRFQLLIWKLYFVLTLEKVLAWSRILKPEISHLSLQLLESEMFKNVGIFVPKEMLITMC